MKWQFSSLLVAVLLLTAQAQPLIEDADYTDVDLVAEESRNSAFSRASSSSSSSSSGRNSDNPYGLSPGYFNNPSGPGAGFHNQPPYGFPPSDYHDRQSFGSPAGHYSHGLPSGQQHPTVHGFLPGQQFGPHGFPTGLAYNPYGYSSGQHYNHHGSPVRGSSYDSPYQHGPGQRPPQRPPHHPPSANPNKAPMKQTKRPAIPQPATKPPSVPPNQPDATSVPQTPLVTKPVVEVTTPPAPSASSEGPADPNSATEPFYDIDIRFGER